MCSGNGIFKWLRAVGVNGEKFAVFTTLVACIAAECRARGISDVRSGAKRSSNTGVTVAFGIRVSWHRIGVERVQSRIVKEGECVVEHRADDTVCAV